VSSHLRLVTAATLIAFGCVISVGALALLPTAAKQPPVGHAAISDPAATSCKPQSWLPFDRSCLTRRDLPWIAERGTPQAAGDADSLPTQSLTESPVVASGPQEVRSEASVLAASSQPSVPPASVRQEAVPQAEVPQEAVRLVSVAGPQESAPQASSAQELVPRQSLQQGNIAASKPLVQRPAAIERRAPKSTIEAETRPPAQKKVASQQRTAKRSTNEDLNEARKKDDKLHDIPVTSYTADGAKRTVVIRPTSVQDAYYYSAPR
jgi:hypothetical protein